MPRKYKKVSCSKTKTAAKKAAVRLRNSGKTASVRKSGGQWCVYSAGAKKKSSTVGRRRRRRRA